MDGVGAAVYCLLPRDLAPRLLEPLRRHFGPNAAVTVIAEHRREQRRSAAERRQQAVAVERDRRRINNAEGRRIAERRAPLVAIEMPELSRRVRAHRDRLAFVERVEPAALATEDADTARLVTRIQAGDADGFGALYARYFDRVFGYLRIILNDPGEAEAATQDVFVKVLEALGRYQRQRQPFRAWLFVIVRNHALNQLDRAGRLDLVDPHQLDRHRDRPEPGPAGLGALEWISDSDLTLFIERLPLAQRQVLVLRYMLDLSPAQIASVLEITPNNVAALHHRALVFLRARLVALGRDPREHGRTRMHRWVKQAPVLRSRRFALLS
jgi:RNA polymerase sigma-70 factor (ECF subfamily)